MVNEMVKHGFSVAGLCLWNSLSVALRDRDISLVPVFLSLDCVSGTLCLSHYVTEISHLYSFGDF